MSGSCCAMARSSAANYCGVCGREMARGKRNRLKVHDDSVVLGGLVVLALALAAVYPYAQELGRQSALVIEDQAEVAASDAPWEPQPAEDEAAGGRAIPASDDGSVPIGVPSGGVAEGDTNQVVSQLLAAWRAAEPADGGADTEGGEADAEAASPSSGGAASGPLTIGSARASTYTYTSRITSYHPSMAIDGDQETGWQVSDGGVGHWIRLDFERAVVLDRLGVVPGYNKTRADSIGDRWFLNNRVSDALITWEGGSVIHHFDDDRAMQWVTTGGTTTSWVQIEVTGIYPGSRWNDTVISEIVAQGNPAPGR